MLPSPAALFLLSLSSSFASVHSFNHLAKRDNPPSSSTHQLRKRADSFQGKATFYNTGLGACGKTNVDSDFIVALNQQQYQANHWCFKTITINYGGKSASAQIVDECPGCPYGALDMSPTLFSHFASQDVGVFYMTWSLNDGSGGGAGPAASSDQDKPEPEQEQEQPKPEPVNQPPPPPPPAPAPVVHKPPPTTSHPKVEQTSNDVPEDESDLDLNSEETSHRASTISESTKTQPTSGKGSAVAVSSDIKPSKSSAPDHSNASTNKTNVDKIPKLETAVAFKPLVPPANAYAAGQNLDSLNQLVLALGSLTAASAHDAISSS